MRQIVRKSKGGTSKVSTYEDGGSWEGLGKSKWRPKKGKKNKRAKTNKKGLY
tara:strand:+ start:319 stop:474 length:156 start_codon:yes stop_codon:yes gene_type:complete